MLVHQQDEVRKTEEEIRKAELRHQEKIKRQQEENLKQQQLALQHQQELRRQKEEEIQRQQELARIEQLKHQELARKAQLEQQELQLKQQESLRLEQLEEQRQQDEACCARCPDQLAAMLKELQSLVLVEKGIERFNQLRQEHQDLVRFFPSDVRQTLKSLDDRFIAAEEQRQKAEENFKKVAQVEGDLRILYRMQLILQVCTERHSEFNSSKIELERLIKSQENIIPVERATVVWNEMANRFQRTEPMMRMRSDYELYTDCDQTRKQVLGVMMSHPGAIAPGVPPRKKDF
jgi:hypothetical protein